MNQNNIQQKIVQDRQTGDHLGREKFEVEIDFKIVNHGGVVKVVTERPDLLWGVSYLEVAPHSGLVEGLSAQIGNYDEIEEYKRRLKRQAGLRKMDLSYPLRGLELKGVKAVNPINAQAVTLWLKGEAIPRSNLLMGVPAHYEESWRFAQEFGLPIRQVVTNDISAYQKNLELLEIFDEIKKRAAKRKVGVWLFGGLALAFWAGVLYRQHSDLNLTLRSQADFKKIEQILKKLGFKKFDQERHADKLVTMTYQNNQEQMIRIARYLDDQGFGPYLMDQEKELVGFSGLLVDKEFLREVKRMQIQMKERAFTKDKLDWQYLHSGALTNINSGVLVNSGEFSGLEVEEGRRKIVEWLERQGVGRRLEARNWKLETGN